MTYILVISCFYHDSAAALLRDGEIIAAAQEERFTRKKHDFEFPTNAIEFCLREAGITKKEINYVAFYEKPFIKFERILQTYLAYAPAGFLSFIKAIPLWVKHRLWIPDQISKELDFDGTILYPEHHESHASAAFFPSPFEHAAILTVDGVGEGTTASFGKGSGNRIELLSEIHFPHSLGLLYSAFTYYTGFKVNSAEYKLMGLAPYGEPKYVDLIMKELIDVKDDGSFKLNMKYFNYCAGLTMTNHRFNKLFGAPPRKREAKVRDLDMDLARSIQAGTEEEMMRIAKHVHQVTGEANLCLSGGVELNCVANGRILRDGPFKQIWIQPAAGDAGGALGAALMAWHHYLDQPRNVQVRDAQKGSFLGPGYTDDEIEMFLKRESVVYKKFSRDELVQHVAKLMDSENVIGWFQGRMEFGPRALGARSIIGDARLLEMQSRMNLKIKFRESFRPFAPSVVEEESAKWFNLKGESPYMLLVSDVAKSHVIDASANQLRGLDKLKVKRSDIPAVTHVDYSARVQTVDKDRNPLYYDLINAFHKKTGCPVIINTSFNVRGEPIVCSPQDAFKCFMRTGMDFLVLGSFVLDKKDQKSVELESIDQFELD